MSDPRPGRERTRPRPTGLTPAGLPSDEPGMRRPPRPVAVEVATAFVIVSGAMSVLLSIEAFSRMNELGSAGRELALPSLGLGFANILLGLLLRYGRAWLIGINVLAIAGFLELISATPMGLVTGALDAIAVVVLMVHRPWFTWRPGRVPGDDLDDDPGD